jgi:hypothetical protein
LWKTQVSQVRYFLIHWGEFFGQESTAAPFMTLWGFSRESPALVGTSVTSHVGELGTMRYGKTRKDSEVPATFLLA